MLVDAHVHLNDPQFEADLEAVVARARAAGVGAMIVAGYDLPSSKRAADLAAQFPEVWAVVGVSPHDARTWDENSRKSLIALASHPKVVGIGEIGLDYHYDRSPRPVQREVFRAQLEVALSLGLPVVIHEREAAEDTLALLREARARRGIMHCFSGSVETAQICWRLGLRISLAGPVTFKNAVRPREVAAAMPLEALLTETDAPYLAPHPHRGSRNEPARVGLVAQAVADARGMSLADLAAAVWRNAKETFDLGPPPP